MHPSSIVSESRSVDRAVDWLCRKIGAGWYQAAHLMRPVRGCFWTDGFDRDSLDLDNELRFGMSRHRIGQES